MSCPSLVAADSAEACLRRKPMPPERFSREMQHRNDQLAALDLPALQQLEFLCARLYTGPLYVKARAPASSLSLRSPVPPLF